MITLLIGHRGVGKSTLLQVLPGRKIDLDRVIAERSGRTLDEWIPHDEQEFRKFELQTLKDLIRASEGPTFIAVGAGFIGPVPEGVHVVWIRRATDASGRSFLNRPRLDPELSPWQEYQNRFPVRQSRFADWAHEELTLPEGESEGLEVFFNETPLTLAADLTLLPENFRRWEQFVGKRKPRLWEIRDDLLTSEQVSLARASLDPERILYSVRHGEIPKDAGVKIDWALEKGAPPDQVFSLSLHERDDDFARTVQRLEAYRAKAQVLKLAIEIHDYNELSLGHRWWCQDPARRSFLPRSSTGRWRGYRSLFGPKMPLHFCREGEGTSLDQPLLWQVLFQPPLKKHFSAVLGDPVEHSLSPREHRHFSTDPFVSFTVREDDCGVRLIVLLELGLHTAAITAPLKKVAWASASRLTLEARATQAVNTLAIHGADVYGHNTDVLALRELRAQNPDYKSVWLWGGGGIKSSVLDAWPEARTISARAGHAGGPSPELLLWAVGRARRFVWPNAEIRPAKILDLNYGDDSPGLEWAVGAGLAYQSGLTMFKLQAQFQREFWAAQKEAP